MSVDDVEVTSEKEVEEGEEGAETDKEASDAGAGDSDSTEEESKD